MVKFYPKMELVHYANIESVIITGPEYKDRNIEERFGSSRNRYRVIVADKNFEWINPHTRESGNDDLAGDGLKLDDAIYLALRYVEPSRQGEASYTLDHLFQKNEQVSVTLLPQTQQAIIEDNHHRQYRGSGANLSVAVTVAHQEMMKMKAA